MKQAEKPQDESNEERGFGISRPVEAMFLRSGSKDLAVEFRGSGELQKRELRGPHFRS